MARLSYNTKIIFIVCEFEAHMSRLSIRINPAPKASRIVNILLNYVKQYSRQQAPGEVNILFHRCICFLLIICYEEIGPVRLSK